MLGTNKSWGGIVTQLFLGVVCLLCFHSCRPTPICENCQQFDHEGISREYFLHIPDSLPKNAALLFVLHGYGGSATQFIETLGFKEQGEEHNFLICYPQGLPDQIDVSHWNADLEISEVDDVGFLTNLALFLQEKYDLNPNRTFTSGISNGGFMSYTLVSEAPEIFKAMASVIGTMSGEAWRKRNENPIAVPILQISGVADYVVPIDGSKDEDGGWGGAPAMDTIISYWAQKNECTSVDTLSLSKKSKAFIHTNASAETKVYYCKIEDFGHDWPSIYNEAGFDCAELIWDFLDGN